MLDELDLLEVRHISELARDARKARDRLLEKVRETDLGEPPPLRGEHNPAANVDMAAALAAEPEFVAIRDAILALPRDLRETLLLVTRIGRGDLAVPDWDKAADAASGWSDDDLAANMLDDADFHDHIQKGLYVIGDAG